MFHRGRKTSSKCSCETSISTFSGFLNNANDFPPVCIQLWHFPCEYDDVNTSCHFLEGIEHFSLPITIRFGRVIPVSCFTHQHHEVMRQGADEPSPKSNSVRGNIFNSIQTLARNEFQIQGSKTLNVHTLQNCSYDPFTAILGMVSYRFYHVLPHYMSIHPSHSHLITPGTCWTASWVKKRCLCARGGGDFGEMAQRPKSKASQTNT